MIIITSSAFMSSIILTAHSMQMEVKEVNIDTVTMTLDNTIETSLSGDYRNEPCYCWTGEDKNIPTEAVSVMSYKDLCAEEYEFPSLEEGDTVFVYTRVETDEGWKCAWHMILFDEIDR